jgi:RNA polymerase sigma-70 factor (ECF subfamily)
MSVEQGDAHLIEAVQRGDQAAWRDVIARYQGRLISFAKRMCNDRAEAEDLVQETFLGLVRSLTAYDASRSLETYLFAILRNKLSDHLRRRRGGQRQSIDSLQVDDAPSAWLDTETPSRYVAGRERLEAQRQGLVAILRQWVEQCTERRRFQDLIVIEMLLVLGLRNKEVAADLDLTEPAVAGVKFRVLEQWRTLAAQTLREEAWDELDLAGESTLARLWQAEGVSCLKRSTLGRFLLGALDEDWAHYVDFHVRQADCDRCQSNLADLQSEDEQSAAARDALRERCFTSSIGFLSKPDG